jgi:hypothetical protein
MVAFHVASSPQKTFSELVAEEPTLVDKEGLSHHFSRDRLFGPDARSDWVEPDLAPFPEPLPR